MALVNFIFRCNNWLTPLHLPQITSLPRIRWASNARIQPQDDGTYKGEKLKRYGFTPHYHTKGLLPRLRIKERRLRTMPISMNEDYWSPRQATLGQNDFIKILGDERVQQTDLLDHVPDYLKGYKAREYSVLQRKRKEFEHWKYTKPLKWLHLEQRIKFLYRRFNNKYKPPEVERLHQSRHCP